MDIAEVKITILQDKTQDVADFVEYMTEHADDAWALRNERGVLFEMSKEQMTGYLNDYSKEKDLSSSATANIRQWVERRYPDKDIGMFLVM